MSKNSDKKEEFNEQKFLEHLQEYWDLGKQYYARDHRRMHMLDQTDNGDFWKAIGAQMPPYQILPDTNEISYVKDNLLASLYTTEKSANILPTSEDDKELCTKLSIFLEWYWKFENIGSKQFQAGERAALLNMGITQVGWNEDHSEKIGDWSNKGQVSVANIDPMSFMRDPFAKTLQTAAWCCVYERFHKSVFEEDKRYSEKFKEWLAKQKTGIESEQIPAYRTPHETTQNKDHYNLIRWWVRNCEGGIDEVHTIDRSVILYKKENIKPSVYPFAILYCNLPSTGLVGASGPAKIFANNVAYNMIQSLALTAEYKNQRPPKFVSAQSGLNVVAFTKHGAEADRTFVVNNDASQAVHYQQFPAMSANVPSLMQGLQLDIQAVSGVDAKYTGRDTGSIITTGGTEEMLNRVTMIDTPKIVNYENYTKDLTKLILLYLMQYSPKRKYFIKKPNRNEYETVEVDFPNLNKETLFQYEISISSELPKNKQRIAAWANMIMEKQMQYRENGGAVELLTEEEWLMMQDVPFKELLLERMGFERDTNALKEVSQAIFQYANLIDKGMSPEDAMLQTAQTLQNTRKGMPVADAEADAANQMAAQVGAPMQMPPAPAEEPIM